MVSAASSFKDGLGIGTVSQISPLLPSLGFFWFDQSAFFFLFFKSYHSTESKLEHHSLE